MVNGLVRASVILIAILVFSACTGGKPSSRVRIVVPKGNFSAFEALPTGYTYCFGVNVSAADMNAPIGGACQPPLATYTGFVGEGGVLSLEVPRGTNRRFELFMYLASSGSACPAWDAAFNSSGKFNQTYSVATTTQSLGGETTDILMTVSFPGTSQTVASQQNLSCAETPKLNGVLYSNGDLRNASDVAFSSSPDPSTPILEWFFKILGGQSDGLGLGRQFSSGDLDIGTTISVPPWVRSVTRKPDSQVLYGLIGEGTIVSLDATTGAPTLLTTATCPFANTSCTVPAWFQSISAGRGTDLFGLDHAGQVYRVKAGDVIEITGTTVSPAVTQVSYY